ncbi:MAG TPA: LamG-like jellyroll fold domain-containing protein [Sedimentisphaerales bacterium]|nr:LamG-like jellyroll fold domain-containing protein [Sedimentisphaerales bacterium]
MKRGTLTGFAAITLTLALGTGTTTAPAAEAARQFFTSFADANTVGLWLFDELQYPCTTLTDAGENWYDLRLLAGGRLVEGRFGNALKVSAGAGPAVCYASIPKDPGNLKKSGGSLGGHTYAPQTSSGLFGETTTPQKIVETLAQSDWTWEFWLRIESPPKSEVSLIDLGPGLEPGFLCSLVPMGRFFIVQIPFSGLTAICMTNGRTLCDGKWHHAAFTFDAAKGKLRHFLDGRAQAESKTYETSRTASDKQLPEFAFSESVPADERIKHRFNFSVGTNRLGEKALDGLIDELRLSNKVRYTDDFASPGSFSRSYGANPPRPSVATGPPLLFGPDAPKGPVQLGSRKHLFIDDTLIDKQHKVKLTVNPPGDPQPTNLNITGEKCVWDEDGKIQMIVTPGYGSEKGQVRLFTSADGIHFDAPHLGLVESDGSKDNNLLMTGARMNGRAFKDPNPNAEPEARYKLAAWLAQRGIYLFVSPDGIHWRRNETNMLPLVSGGGSEAFWDDQRGLYVYFMKRDSSFRPGRGRRASIAQTCEAFKPWPFKPLAEPYYEGWAVPAITEELPVAFGVTEEGQVYRTRAVKYEWAPDTYLAFVWRYESAGNFRQTELATSRDGMQWKAYGGDPWYMAAGITYKGQKIGEALSDHGLIRRNDEIWQYAVYKTGLHGDDSDRTHVRLTQRLDGFVSLDAGAETGWAVTRPLIFEGRRLTLNVAAKGSMRVGILDEQGNELKGFTLADCDPIMADATALAVGWKGNTDVGKLAGKVVRLKFEMQDTKLYCFKFN